MANGYEKMAEYINEQTQQKQPSVTRPSVNNNSFSGGTSQEKMAEYIKSQSQQTKPSMSEDSKKKCIDLIASYITQNSNVKTAIKTYNTVQNQYTAAKTRNAFATIDGAVKDLAKTSPEFAIKAKYAVGELSKLLKTATGVGLGWNEVVKAAEQVGVPITVGKATFNEIVTAMDKHYDTGTKADQSNFDKILYKNHKGQFFSTIQDAELALKNYSPKQLATEAVSLNTLARTLEQQIASVARGAGTSADQLGNNLNFGKPEGIIKQYLANASKLKAEQEGLAKLVDAIPTGSKMDYDFLEAFIGEYQNDPFQDGTTLANMKKALETHASNPTVTNNPTAAIAAEALQKTGGNS